MPIEAVLFDVGETLIDETQVWQSVADACGVPRLTFMAVLGGVIGRGEPHQRVFEMLAIEPPRSDRPFSRVDLYPDALSCLGRLRAAGYRVGVAGNQAPQRQRELEALVEPVDLVATSGGLGVEKPAIEFFLRLAGLIGVAVDRCAYVGDRVDNDVEPALTAGMTAVFILRGPWAHLQREPLPAAAIAIESLDELPSRLQT
jgi:HAD superfamily hydrolase (TIGR01509 family)